MESNYIEEFHQYLKTICDSIKFTKKRRTWRYSCFSGCAGYTHPRRIATNHSVQKTNSYRQIPIPFSSDQPLQPKLSISTTLFSRAENIIKEDELKMDDIRTINNTLITDGYPRFHRKRRPTHSESESQQTKIMTVIPNVQNLTEPIKRVLQQVGAGVAIKLVCALFSIFGSPKTKFWTKTSRVLFIKYLVVTAMRCTSVEQAET